MSNTEFIRKARTVCDEISKRGWSCEDCPLGPDNNFSSENCGYEMLHYSVPIEKDLDCWIAQFATPANTPNKNTGEVKPMEFKELMEKARQICEDMVEKGSGCSDCPLCYDGIILNCGSYFMENPEDAEKTIIEYFKEHHQITLLQKFKDLFPDTPIAGHPNFCPSVLGRSFTGPDWKAEDYCGGGCAACWNSLVPKKF